MARKRGKKRISKSLSRGMACVLGELLANANNAASKARLAMNAIAAEPDTSEAAAKTIISQKQYWDNVVNAINWICYRIEQPMEIPLIVQAMTPEQREANFMDDELCRLLNVDVATQSTQSSKPEQSGNTSQSTSRRKAVRTKGKQLQGDA